MSQTQVETKNDLRQRRYSRAAVLLQKWSTENPTYDERVGEALERELEREPLRCEEPDDTPA